MEHHRTGGALVAALVDVAAVVADGGSGIEPRGGEPGDGAAPAVADDGGLAGAGDEAHGGGNVEQRRIPGDLGADGAARGHVVLVVAELDATLDTVEEGGGDGQVAVGGKKIGRASCRERVCQYV